MKITTDEIKKIFAVLKQKYCCPWCGEECISAFAKMRLVNPLNKRECPKCRKYIKVKLPWKNWLWTLVILLSGLALSLWIPFHYQFISPIILAMAIVAIKDIFITVPKLPILKD